jgi:hypothetical protein
MNEEIVEANQKLEGDNKKIEEVYSKLFKACVKFGEQIETVRVFAQERSQETDHVSYKKSLYKIQMLLIDLQMKSSIMAGKIDEHMKNPKNYKPLYIEDTDETAPTEEKKEEEARLSEQEPNQL